MKYMYASCQGRKQSVHGWIFRIGVLCVAVACLLIPVTVNAANTITQGEFLGWLASATGDSKDLSPSATTADLVAWAQTRGLNPNGGWAPDAVLTKEVLAQTLVQLFSLNPKKYNGDFEKNLLREGIVLPAAKDLTRQNLAEVMDQFGMKGKLDTLAYNSPSPGGRTAGKIPGGFLNPKNPWYGTPTDQLPGAGGIANAATRGNRAP